MRTSRGGERVEAVGSLKSRARRSARRHFVMRVALRVLLLALAVGPCIAGGDRDAAAQSADFASRAETFDVPASQRVEVFPPANYDSTAVGDARPPLLVFLHGFCLPDANQQAYNFTAVRANAGGGRLPRRQTLSQVGLREVVDERGFVYATPTAPHHTRKCALCNLGDASPNVADQLTTTWINQTMSRVAPAFACPAWDGSDACCNPELGGEGDDARFLEKTVEALLDAYAIDPNRVYLVGIATGGFMANRMACERPDLFAGVVTFAGGVWNDPTRCAPPAGAATNVLNVHGTADLTVPIEGGVNFAGVRFPSAERTVETLADAFACDAETSERRFAFPTGGGSPTDALDVEAVTRRGCGADGAREVERWTVVGADHFWETPTSRAMFAAAVDWLAPKTRNEA